MKITKQQLIDAGAHCQQMQTFTELFGDSAEVTVEQCGEHAGEFDWDWAASHLFPEPLWAEYQRQLALLQAEYDRQRAPLWADYDRQRAGLLADHERQRALLQAEYESKRAPLWADYESKRAPLWADYDRQRAGLLAEYKRHCAPLQAECERHCAALFARLYNSQGGPEMKTETIVYRQYVEPHRRKTRLRILSGDHTAAINREPSYSYNGQTYYSAARLVTARDRRAQWYRDAQFDDQGNSDWLS